MNIIDVAVILLAVIIMAIFIRTMFKKKKADATAVMVARVVRIVIVRNVKKI